jgi:hypothetical protein
VRVAAIERALEHRALGLAAQQQQSRMRRRQAGGRQADPPRPWRGARAAAGIDGDVGTPAFKRKVEFAHAREQGRDMAVVAHAQQDDARWMARMQVGVGDGGLDAAPRAGQGFETRRGSMPLQQVLAHEVGIAVGIVRAQPALVDQCDVDPVPLQRRLRQRAEHRRGSPAARDQQPRTPMLLQVAAQRGRDRHRDRPHPLVVVAVGVESDRGRSRPERPAAVLVRHATPRRLPPAASAAVPSRPGCGWSTASVGTRAIAGA